VTRKALKEATSCPKTPSSALAALLARLQGPANVPSRLAEGGSLLCRDGAERRRLMEMELELRPVRTALFALLMVAILAMGPYLGFWPLGPLAGAAIGFAVGDLLASRSPKPEYPLMAAWCFSQLMIALAALRTGGAHSLFLSWPAIPAATLTTRFNIRGVLFGVLYSAVLVVAVAAGSEPGTVLHHPQLVIAPVTVLFGVTLLSTAMMHSDVRHRYQAVVDPLTGLLNRHAFLQRAPELLARQRFGEPISLILADLDHFKEVNDRHGHLVGDRVLQAVAECLRSSLRAFDQIYRYGGEELIVLLPASLEEAVQTAERLRQAVACARPAGLPLTVSLGVACARPGETLEGLVARADQALYAAKAAGRDRVCAHA
jgi:diguanylate cyclase (GGDEF)-like protein